MTPRQFPSLSSLLTTAMALALAVVLAVAAAGGTYALWNTQQGVGGGVITTGSAALTVTGATALPTTGLYPGQTTTGELAVTNIGTVPLRLRLDGLATPATTAGGSAAVFATALRISLWPKTGTTCAVPPAHPAWSGRVGAPATDLGLTLHPGTTQAFCLAVTLPPEAPSGAQGGSAALDLSLGGVQQ